MPVIFDEDQNYRPQNYNQNKGGWMVPFLMDKGIAKSETAANIILLVIAGFCIVITIWLLKPNNSVPNNNAEIPEDMPMRSGFQDLPRELQ